MKITDFDIYRDLLVEKSGLELDQDEIYLLESRLTPIAKKWGYGNLDDMTLTLNGVPDPDMITDIIEAMMVNDTRFFRDFTPFDIFKDRLENAFKNSRAKAKNLRIWCAGCASGQDAYSLAILLNELSPGYKGWRFEILATDISEEKLNQAREGVYSQFEAQRGMPSQLLIKHFAQKGDQWRLGKDIRNMVSFKQHNLIEGFSDFGTFDIIFCRNVLKNFESTRATRVLSEFAKHMEPDALLFLGKGETDAPAPLSPLPDTSGVFTLKGSPHLA